MVTREGVVDGEMVMVKGSSFETVLSGLRTYTSAVAAEVVGSKKLGGMLNSLAGMVAVNWVLDPNVVVMATPFHIMVLPLTKPVPVAVSVSGVVIPLGEVFGLMDVSVGGVPRPPLAIMVRGSVLVVELSGLVTPTVMVPAAATREAVTVP